MKWLWHVPQQRTPEVDPAAREAVERSRESIRAAESRSSDVEELTASMATQLRRNHLAERIELAMKLRTP